MRARLLFIVLVFISCCAVAQTYNFTRYSEEKGLIQSYIYCISQSPQGYLVLSTGENVTMFDGRAFTSVFNKNMKENSVTTHFIDSRNTTWLGHRQGGISYIYYKHPVWMKDTLLSDYTVAQFSEDDQKNVWMAGSKGLYYIDTNLNITKLKVPAEKAFNCVTFDEKNNMLAGSMEGLSVFSLDKNNAILTVNEVAELKDKNVKQVITADATGMNYWVLADDRVYGISRSNTGYRLATVIENDPESEGTNVSCIYRDKSDNLWISFFGKGLQKISFRGNPMQSSCSFVKINRQNGLQSQNIQSIFQDTEGNMWFGTFGDGLIKKPLEMFSFFGSNEGLLVPDIKKIVTGPHTFWMATNAGLAMYNEKTGSYTLYNETNGFINGKVTTLYRDAQKLWIGTEANGIYTLDIKTKKFENFSGARKLKISCVNCITRVDNNIVIATVDGLSVCNLMSDRQEQLSTNEGLFHNNINHVFFDSKKRLWVSSHGAPPYYIQNQKITPLKEIEGLSSYNIIAVCEDGTGVIWIATDGDGVFKYTNDHFDNYTTQQGLLSDYCTGIEVDKNNSVWVTHRSGLSELDNQLKKFSNFTAPKGLLFSENNINAVYRDSAANLWFGTTKGIVAHHVESAKLKPGPPQIFITDVQLNEAHFLTGDQIVRPYGYYSIHIEFKAISLTDPEAIYYKYRLTNVDTTWKVTNMPYIDFPKLGDGDYTFEVMACNSNNGLYSAKPLPVLFTIQKPVWKHIWFYMLIALVIFFGSYTAILYRTKALKKTQALLQLKVEQKTYLLKREKEAVETIKTDLEHKNKDITASIHYAKNIQDSLLPPEELMQELFHNNSFVLYKPKDIVSGDFYWCSNGKKINGDGICMAAVIDCTGHGVPGAFLSILANDFLKQSLTDKSINTPAEILNYLNHGISSHLNQHSSKNVIRDGMDIALVGISYAHKKLYYSGANNPMYLFRDAGDCVEEIIIKPTKQAIGSVNDVIIDYNLEVIDLREGDMIYLFSDGYADQFGGERNKKITYKTFRTILAEAFRMPVQQQRVFIEAKLEAWRNGTEQTDDICVMGIRI